MARASRGFRADPLLRERPCVRFSSRFPRAPARDDLSRRAIFPVPLQITHPHFFGTSIFRIAIEIFYTLICAIEFVEFKFTNYFRVILFFISELYIFRLQQFFCAKNLIKFNSISVSSRKQPEESRRATRGTLVRAMTMPG